MFEPSSFNDNLTKRREVQKIIGINTPLIMPDTMYYVKYKNYSYRDCKFITRKELLNHPAGRYLESKLRKQPYPFRSVSFVKNLFKPITYDYDEGFLVIEKVISDRFKSGKHQFLIKWLSLDYDEVTWEEKESIISSKLIHEYSNSKEKFNDAYSKSFIGNMCPPRFQFLDQRRTLSQYHEMTESIQYKNGLTLFQYQIDGINWIHKNWILHRNSILSDEKGLGKSVQIICFLLLLNKIYGIRGTFLILTPFLNISKWVTEVKKWSNFRTVCLTGNFQSRKIIEQYCLYYNGTDQSKLIFDILIVPIESIKHEFSILNKIYFMFLIVDDFQYLTNSNSELYEQIQQIKTDFILLLSSTSPMQNGINELWSILHFIDPSNFANLDFFIEKFYDEDDKEAHKELNEIVKPYFLRRVKSDLIEKVESNDENEEEKIEEIETIIEAEMTPFQRVLYKAILKENREFLIQNFPKTKYLLNSILIELRKITDHPFLLNDAESVFISQFQQSKKIPEKEQKDENNNNNSYEEEYKSYLTALINASGKLILLNKLLPKLVEMNQKILIFCNLNKMIDIIDNYIYSKGYKFERIDGNKNLNSKKISIEKFNSNLNSFILLLSNCSELIGLDLIEINSIIIFDSEINQQCIIHDIGKDKQVNFYRFVTKDSYEEFLFENQDKEKIELALKKSAYHTFLKQGSEYEKFCDETIDQILENRSKVINLNEMDDTDSNSSKSIFLNSMRDRFSLFQNDKGVDFESPDFWSSLLHPGNIDLPEFDPSKVKKSDNFSHFIFNDKETNKNIKFEEENKIKNRKRRNSIDEDYEEYNDEDDTKSDSESDGFQFNIENEDDEIQLKKRKRRRKTKFFNRKSNFDVDIKMANIKINDSSSDDDFFDDSSYSLFRKESRLKHFLSKSEEYYSRQPILTSTNKQKTSSRLPPLPIQEEKIITKDQFDHLKRKADEDTHYLLSNKIKPALALLFNFGLYGSRYIKESPIKHFSQLFLLSLIYYTKCQEERDRYLKYVKNVKPDILSKSEYITRLNISDLAKEEVVYQGVINLASAFREIDRSIVQNPNRSIHEIDKVMEEDIAPYICCLILAMKDKAPTLDVVIKKVQFYDSSYRAAVYISNEVLPSNFYFAPSIPFHSFPFWDVEMDFMFFCGTIIYGIMNMKHVFTDPKLPFSLINQQIFPSIGILNTKFQLILNEVSLIIPNDYSVEGKLINDISYFKFVNWRLFNKTVISWNIKKQIFRGLYFYGIPLSDKNNSESNNEIVKKLKFIFHAEEIEDFAFKLFISAVLTYARRYQPEISVGPFDIRTRVIIRIIDKVTGIERIEVVEPISKSSKNDDQDYVIDLRWLEDDQVQTLCRNIFIYQRARFYYNYLNSRSIIFDMQNMPNLHMKLDFNFPIWSSYMQNVPPYWDNECDIKLFNVTACYGFLLFSELGRALMKISPNNIAVWKLNEIKSIRPLMPKVAEPLNFLFASDTKIERLEVIIHVIQKTIEEDNARSTFRAPTQ